MLCLRWDHISIIPFEFSNCYQTLNIDLYSQQQQCAHENLLRKCCALISTRKLFHDNTKPHSTRITLKKILNFVWFVLPHPPYSPVLSPSDFDFFIFNKTLSMTKKIFLRSEENIRRKPFEFKTRGILFDSNQQTLW